MSPHSVYASWMLASQCGEDAATAMLIAAAIE